MTAISPAEEAGTEDDGYTLAGQFINHEAAIDLDLTYWHLGQCLNHSLAEEPLAARVCSKPR